MTNQNIIIYNRSSKKMGKKTIIENRTEQNIMINIDITSDIGRQMRNICETLNLKHKNIAIAIGVSQTLLSYYFNNKRVQKVDILRKFLEYCRSYPEIESRTGTDE